MNPAGNPDGISAGGYQFNDFVRVGTPLTLLIWLTLSAVLIFAYNLQAG